MALDKPRQMHLFQPLILLSQKVLKCQLLDSFNQLITQWEICVHRLQEILPDQL